MKNKTLLDWIILVGIILMMFCTLWVLITREPLPLVGSVANYNDYQSTTTRSFAGTALTNFTVLSQGQGAVGSVVITGANTGIIYLYDATTTGPHSDHATTTLVQVPASAAAGTYTFDIQFTRGLVYELVSGLAPTTTITFRK